MKVLRKALGIFFLISHFLVVGRGGVWNSISRGPERVESIPKPQAFRARSLAKATPALPWDTAGASSPLCASVPWPPKGDRLRQHFSNLMCMKSEEPVEMQIVIVEPEILHFQPAPTGCCGCWSKDHTLSSKELLVLNA